jgi:hypothetical protein
MLVRCLKAGGARIHSQVSPAALILVKEAKQNADCRLLFVLRRLQVFLLHPPQSRWQGVDSSTDITVRFAFATSPNPKWHPITAQGG